MSNEQPEVKEVDGLSGNLPSGKIAIVASRYNESICDAMVRGAIDTLSAAGYPAESLSVVRVPGAWELPFVVRRVLDGSDEVIAAIALGAVIKGETTHDEHINRAVSLSLMEIGIDCDVPVGFGLLTCNTLEQAINRSGGTVGNKGVETADAVLQLLRLGEKLSA